MRCGQLFNRLENHWADVDAAGVCVTPRALLRDMAQTVAFTKLGRADARAFAGEARLMAATGTTSATCVRRDLIATYRLCATAWRV